MAKTTNWIEDTKFQPEPREASRTQTLNIRILYFNDDVIFLITKNANERIKMV